MTSHVTVRNLLATVLVLLTVAAIAAVEPPAPADLEMLAVAPKPFWTDRTVESLDHVLDRLDNRSAWVQALEDLGDAAGVSIDTRTGEPAMVVMEPEPWIPGRGNTLSLEDVSARLGRQVPAVTEDILRDLTLQFISRHQPLLRVPSRQLSAPTAALIRPGLWVVTVDHRPSGVPVATARLTLVIGHGNLILWGSDALYPVDPSTALQPEIAPETAAGLARQYVGWRSGHDVMVREPELELIPVLKTCDREDAVTQLGAGSSHRLVWKMGFTRAGSPANWIIQVDARTGEIVQLSDATAYTSWVRGGIQPVTWSDPEEHRPLPFVSVGSGQFASLEGLYTNPGSTVTATLDGSNTHISDMCGSSGTPGVNSGANDTIDFGVGPPNPTGDADCTTNGVGLADGAHNTHAARSAYYHISWIKEKGHRWLPSVGWLTQPHTVNVNEDDVCNAYWSPLFGTNGFYREGYTSEGVHCFNTGEIAGVFLHEVGHGLDQHDAQGTGDRGTGEAYADTHAFLHLHDSCIGPGFRETSCTGYGPFPCTDCTGVRDVDFAKHTDASGAAIADPFTPANFTAEACSSSTCTGPCGLQCHCESHPATGAIWDLATRRLTAEHDAATAWYIAERDWYLGMQIARNMFNCNSSTFASDGCAATSWFNGLLAADDDNGDLTDGTPHAAAIYAAFSDHAIACGDAADPAHQDSQTCPTLATPVASATVVGNEIQLDWDPVTGADGYTVLRNHGSCADGYIEVGSVPGGTETWTDSGVVDYQAYSYRVLANGASDACFSDLSSCLQATISDCPEAVSEAPLLTAPADNRVDIDWPTTGSCSAFHVERRTGGCGTTGFATVSASVETAPVSDLSVSGGITYGYRVRAVAPDAVLVTGPSPCAEITPSGVCNERPAFAGAALAGNSHTAHCGIDLTWTAGATPCPGQTVVYNVYRGNPGGFMPGSDTLVASGLSGTEWHDGTVAYGSSYGYIVRAEALSGAGPGPNGGVEDANNVIAVAAPSGPDAEQLFHDVEANTTAWHTMVGSANDSGTDPWTVVTTDAYSPVHSWFCADESDTKDQVLISPTVQIPAGAPARLEFWHAFDFETRYDGGVLEYSTNDGATWNDVLEGDADTVPANPNRFLANEYNDTLYSSSSNPLSERDAWTSSISGWQKVELDLTDMAGLDIRLRWRVGCDGSVSYVGWWVDDIRVFYGTECTFCALAPEFTGIASVTDHGTPQAALDVAWPAAADQCDTGEILYSLYHGGSAGSVDWNAPILVTEQTDTTVMGILPGTMHCFGVRAQDGYDNMDSNASVVCGTPSGAVGTGEAGCDGSISPSSLLDLTAVLFGASQDCGTGFAASDVNLSGTVDSGDLAGLIGYLHDGI